MALPSCLIRTHHKSSKNHVGSKRIKLEYRLHFGQETKKRVLNHDISDFTTKTHFYTVKNDLFVFFLRRLCLAMKLHMKDGIKS